MQDEDIKTVVQQTIQSLPDNIKSKLSNIEVAVEDRPPIRMMIHEQYSHKPQPIHFYTIVLPQKIVIYKAPLLRTANTLDDARAHIKDVIIKAISSYFGVSEFELRRVRPSTE